MILDGYGTEQIASIFESEGILTPRAYWLKKGIRKPGRAKQQPSTKWNASTIVNILTLQEYCGDVLNFKTYSKSYKNKKRIPVCAEPYGRCAMTSFQVRRTGPL